MAEKKEKKKKEKRKKEYERRQSHIASPTGIANKNETGSRSPCMRPRSDPPKMKNSMPDKIVAEKKITKRIGWQATVQNWSAGPSSTLNLESLRVTVPEIWPGQNRGEKKKR